MARLAPQGPAAGPARTAPDDPARGDAPKAGARARLGQVRLTYDGGVSWALDGLSLTVASGERLCVLGPNGSGKSTLAQLLGGLEAPDAGTVELAGLVAFDGSTPNNDAYRAARHRTGLVFQNPADQIVTSIVADDVAFGPENLGVAHEEIVRRVDEELTRVAMKPYAQADPAQLSGGQQQRVAIAGALAMHPDLLVLDEPGAMLDVRGQRAIMRVLDKLQAGGTTLVHITHTMDEALAADHVVVLSGGRVALEGTPREVFAHADELRELGLAVPLVTRVALDLGLPTCCTVDELAWALAAHPASSRLAGATRQRAAVSSPVACPDVSAPSGATNAAAPAGQQLSALRFSHVNFRYGTAPTITDVSLEVHSGELLALVGQTGSGKSTLARLACALALPERGSVEVDGVDTSNRARRRALRGRVGYVMQSPERQLFAQTVFDDVAYGPRNLGLDDTEVERRVGHELEFFGLVSKAQASPFELSGGQQRLAALAGVLAMRPEILVLDEPVAGLDPRGAQKLHEIIRSLHARGVAILMLTHSMEDVAELADRVVVLDAGRVALEGTPSEVFAQGGKLHKFGLGVPAPLALAQALQTRGITVHGAPLTRTDLVDALTRGAEQPC